MPNSKRKLIDLTGQVFGRWTVIQESDRSFYKFRRKGYENLVQGSRRNWLCVCQCGNEAIITHGALIGKSSTSCGCFANEKRFTQSITHGASYTPEYSVWSKMRGRCNNPNSPDAPDYSERGITVCERWSKFENFLEDMGKRLSPQHTIERIDNDKGYSPDNCKWATPIEQGNNKRNNILLTFQGETHTLAEWSRIRHINYPTLRARIREYNWDAERALTEPVLPTNNLEMRFPKNRIRKQ